MGSEFGMRLNVWFLLSSIPGRMRRSTVHNYENYVYKTTLEKFYLDEERKKKISASIIDEGTPEGITDHINQNPELSAYVIKTPEFGGVLAKTKEGGYEYGLPTFLSKLYDGEEWTQYLSTRTGKPPIRHIPRGLYVSMFSGMQEPELYLDEKMLRQGLLRRIIICYVTPDMLSMSDWKPPIFPERFGVWGELDAFVDELVILMNKYRKATGDVPNPQKNPIDITFHPNVIESINACAQKYDERLTKPDISNLDIYQQGCWEQHSKLSMLEAVSRGELIESKPIGKFVFVSERDYERAQKFLKNVSKTNELVADSLVSSEEVKTSKRALDRVYLKIENAGSAGIDHSTLSKNLHLKTKEVTELIDSLISQDRIRKGSRRIGKAGSETIFYTATKFPEEK